MKVVLFTAILLLAAATLLPGAEPPPAPKPAPAAKPENAEVRYARTQLQLAELNLQRAERTNQRVAKAVPADVLAELREQVEVGKARLASAIGGAGPQRLRDWLRGAEASLRAAEARWQSAVGANQRVRNAVDAYEVERLRLRAELARLNLERGRALADKPWQDQIQWELDSLYDEVQQFKEELRRAPPSGGAYPVYPLWWY